MHEACRVRRWGLRWLALSCLPSMVLGAQVLEVSVNREQERFIMHAETWVQVPVAEVRAMLTDYANLPRINQALKRVDILERRKDGGVRMGVVSEFCLLAICLDFNWVQDVQALPNGNIAIAMVPDQGDFRQGSGCWRLLSDNGGTRLIFDIDLTPNIWIPPAFGPWLMKSKLSDEAFETGQGLERYATSNRGL